MKYNHLPSNCNSWIKVMAFFKELPTESKSIYSPDKGYGEDPNAITIEKNYVYEQVGREIEPILPTKQEIEEGISLMRIGMIGSNNHPKALDFLFELYKKLV
jgi:hypothetical protein